MFTSGSVRSVSRSLSARRAWIEIIMFVNLRVVDGVALRKESVDRNFNAMQIVVIVAESLSARRAWIEMICYPRCIVKNLSLSARRAWIEIVLNA